MEQDRCSHEGLCDRRDPRCVAYDPGEPDRATRAIARLRGNAAAESARWGEAGPVSVDPDGPGLGWTLRFEDGSAMLVTRTARARPVPAPAPPGRADGWCETCGSPVGQDDRCACWCLLADGLQQFLGMDHDGSAQMAADLWDAEADKGRVWRARYAGDHVDGSGAPVRTYPPPPALAALWEQDRRGFPHDEDCPRCGRRQWGLGPDVADPDNPSDAEQETCGWCGWHWVVLAADGGTGPAARLAGDDSGE